MLYKKPVLSVVAGHCPQFNRLILYSNTRLERAIGIYKKLGFKEVSAEEGVYKRCDIKMELLLKSSYLESALKQFEYYKMLAEKAMEQLPEEKLFWQYNAESNSIAIIANHMVGNMLSRFTNFLTSDGEKPWRNRDAEFENDFSTWEQLQAHWNKGWACVLEALGQLSEADLETIVYIRNEGHTVTEAINRQLAHYAYHVGQIVYIAKMVKDDGWKSLSIPRNRSAGYNQRKFSQEKGKRHFTDDL